MANLFEATAPLRAHPWFGHAFGLAGLLLALWLRFAIGDGLVGYPFITFFPVVVLTAFLGGTGAGVVCAAPRTDLPVKTLVTLSLIATEAITNSLKHAWPGGGRGTIRIALERPEPGRVALSVSDDGRGAPPDHDIAQGDSLGFRIIRSLVQQLGGELSVAAEGGTTTRVVFSA